MALDVRLGDDVEAELVTEVEERRVVRVVRGSDGRDVVGPHLHEVGAHVVGADGLATVGMVVVAVDAEDPDRLPVDAQLPVADLDSREPDQLLLGVPDPP